MTQAVPGPPAPEPMKTLVIRVQEARPGQGWPVELCFDDGTQGWDDRPAAEGLIAAKLAPLQLPPLAGGGQLTLPSIVRFLLDHPTSPAYLSIGQGLFDLLHESGIGPAWDELRAQHEAPPGGGLRTILEVEPGDLKGLPWETLNQQGRALFLDPRNPFARGPVDHANPVEPRLVPLRILVVVGNPRDTQLQWEEEVDAIRDGLLGFRGRVEADFLLGPTPLKLVDVHAELQPDIFHFIGHGIESPSGLGPALLFNNEQEGMKELIGPDIMSRLRTATGRLAILNACRTDQAKDQQQRESLHRQTWSLGEAFRKAGYLAVIGMQADIPSAAAVAFAGTLYRQLAQDKPIDVAVAEARMRIGDRKDAPANTLVLRDWVLPTLLVSTPPPQALAVRYGVTSEVLDRIENTDEFREIAAFVDRSAKRREVWCQLEGNGQAGSRDLMVVHGDGDLGKTWLVRHCLRTCAWRGRAVRYISFEDQSNLDLLGALRIIKDGSRGSFISGPLPSAAHRRLTHDLSYLCKGSSPPPFRDSAPAVDGCTEWNPGEQLDKVFGSLIEALRVAAGGAPLIVALDQLEAVEESALRQLAEHFLRPTARGLVTPVRVIVALRSTQLQERWWPVDLTSMAKMVQVEAIEDDFGSLAREFLRYHRYDLARVSRLIGAYREIAGPAWSPSLLRDIKKGLDTAKVPRGP